MAIRLLTSAEDLALYDTWVTHHPQGSLWQSLAWKTYQEALGRAVRVYAEIDQQKIYTSALVVIDRTTGGFSTWDIPRGPLGPMENGEWRMENFLEKIIADAKQEKCISIFFSPIKKTLILNSQFSILNSTRHEQPVATRILDLTLSDEDLLKQMHQKGRYNMKVAEKAGVRIEESTDVEAYAKMASSTAKRDGFIGGSARKYIAFLKHIPGSFLLLAYVDHSPTPIAGLIGVIHGKMGIYYYGASDYNHRSLMAPYLLQWEAMKKCKEAGCTSYDLLGIAPADNPNHPWVGISDFKAKFGGSVITYPPEQEIVLKPVMRSLLQWKRKILG